MAVILVVHCHTIDHWENTLQGHFFYLENFGAVGVDIFFVISGFIITIISYPYAKDKRGFYFFIKRMARVVPLYWLVSLWIVVADYLHTGKLLNTGSILKTILFIPFLSDKVAFTAPVIFQGWTLSFELIFYITVSIAMLAGAKRYLFFTALFFLAFICLNTLTKNQDVFINFAGNGIMLEFLLGVMTGVIFLSDFYIDRSVASIIFITGIAGLLATLFFGYGNISEVRFTLKGSLSILRSVMWGLPSALLVAGLVLKEKACPVKVYPFWLAIGNASYSIYLTHFFLLRSVHLRWAKWGLQQKVPPDIQVLISLAIVIAAGYIFYRLVEVPVLRWLGNYVNLKMERKGLQKIQGHI